MMDKHIHNAADVDATRRADEFLDVIAAGGLRRPTMSCCCCSPPPEARRTRTFRTLRWSPVLTVLPLAPPRHRTPVTNLPYAAVVGCVSAVLPRQAACR